VKTIQVSWDVILCHCLPAGVKDSRLLDRCRLRNNVP